MCIYGALPPRLGLPELNVASHGSMCEWLGMCRLQATAAILALKLYTLPLQVVGPAAAAAAHSDGAGRARASRSARRHVGGRHSADGHGRPPVRLLPRGRRIPGSAPVRARF